MGINKKVKTKIWVFVLAIVLIVASAWCLTTNRWVKYESKCSGFSDISIYYPVSWKLGNSGETKISDGHEGTDEAIKQYDSQCLIQFGYPKSPASSQDSYVPGQKTEVIVEAQDLPSEFVGGTLEDYLKNSFKGVEVKTNIKKISGKEWGEVNFNSGEVVLLTINGNKVYWVMSISWGDNHSIVQSETTFKMAEKIAQKIQFR